MMSQIYLIFSPTRIPHVRLIILPLISVCAAILLSATANAATINVTALNDTLSNNGACSIREAVINANNDAATWPDCAAGAGADTIALPTGTITFTLPNSPNSFTDENLSLTGDLDINSPMTISGNSGGTVIDGAALDRIFDVDPDTDGDPTTPPPFITVHINDLTVTNGRQNDVGGIRVRENATVTIDNSTVSNCNAWANDGGGVGNFGTLTMTNCTISGNFAQLLGGGMSNFGSLSLVSCTVTNNDSSFNNLVGGIANESGTTTLRNTIVAGNQGVDEPNLRGSFTSAGFNVIGTFGTAPPTIVATTGDQFNVSDAAVQLGVLANNGGPTMTHALGGTSLAIDQGHSTGSTRDQRGLGRPCNLPSVVNAPGGDGSDVGAFEVQGGCVTNTAPVAVNDTYNINQDTLLNPAAPGVLGNDTDVDGDALTATLQSGPSHAQSFSFNANGSFSYNPVTSFTGVDSFTYKANDGLADSAVATVTINIADTEPPNITASVAQGSLWPPNHDLINVGLSVTVTDNSAGPITTEVKVFSNEDDLAPASGNASPDATNLAAGTLRLRSERSGNGSGRIYLILIEAKDPSNNVSRKCLSVVVPKSQSAAHIAAVNAAAGIARALCEATGNPPAGYFVVGDGPVVNPHLSVGSKERGKVAASSVSTQPKPTVPADVSGNSTVLSVSGPGYFPPLADEGFGVKEYDDFHHLLHQLQHEALPKNDLATIRSKAKELIKLGDAIVKLGVPKGTKGEDADTFQAKLGEFAKALEKYGSDAESGADADLKSSYSAVHEKFEELADRLPKK